MGDCPISNVELWRPEIIKRENVDQSNLSLDSFYIPEFLFWGERREPSNFAQLRHYLRIQNLETKTYKEYKGPKGFDKAPENMIYELGFGETVILRVAYVPR